MIKAAFRDSRETYGAPRIQAELRAHGVRVGKKRVARLMRRRLGHEAVDEHDRDCDRDRSENEQPAPGEVIHDDAGQDDAEAAAHAEHCGQQNPTFTRSGGSSSRMMAKLSWNSAPPAPESARNPISDQMSQAAAAPIDPARKGERVTSSMRSLPY